MLHSPEIKKFEHGNEEDEMKISKLYIGIISAHDRSHQSKNEVYLLIERDGVLEFAADVAEKV